MAWFKKRKDVVDLTYLTKRGILKVPSPNENVSDLTGSALQASEPGFGFLAGMASSAETETKQDSGMKNKIDDFEYKLDAISKRVNMMLDRLDLVEKKLARDLRSGSLD